MTKLISARPSDVMYKASPAIKRCGTALAVLSASCLLSACAPAIGPNPASDILGARAATGFIPLEGPMIFNQFSGKTLAGGVNNGAGSWAVYNREDGFAVFQAGRSFLDVEWSVKGNRYCLGDVGDSDKLCFDVFHRNGTFQLVDEEGVKSFYTTNVASGDTYRLLDFVSIEDEDEDDS